MTRCMLEIFGVVASLLDWDDLKRGLEKVKHAQRRSLWNVVTKSLSLGAPFFAVKKTVSLTWIVVVRAKGWRLIAITSSFPLQYNMSKDKAS